MRLSETDASFLYTETASGAMHGIAIFTLEGNATYTEIYNYYAARIHLIPKFRHKLAFVPFNFAHPKWIDDPYFDLTNHLKPHPVPPGTTMEDAINIGLDLGEPLLDRSRPLWLTYVIEGIEDKTLVVQMTHHAFVDGATAMAISTLLTDTTPDAAAPEPPTEPWQPAPEPSQMALWQEASQEQLGVALSAFQITPLSADMISRSSELLQRMARPVIQAPWNNGLVGPTRRLSVLRYTLDDFKTVSKALGGTVNDVAVAIAIEGAARYMIGKGLTTEDQSLRIMCPVDVRDPGSDPKNMEGNRVSGMFPILDASHKSMTDRYEEVKAEMLGIKTRKEPETLDALQQAQPATAPVAMTATLAVGTPLDPTQWAARVPSPIAPNFGLTPQQAGFNFTLTNVPGPTWSQYMAGHEVLETAGTLMLGGNLGLGITLGSFAGKIIIVFTVDPRLLPDPNKLRDLVDEAYTELSALAVAANPETDDV
jgi:diacylglycerol O-acyltransferase